MPAVGRLWPSGDDDDDDDGDSHLVGNNGSLTECPARPFSGLGERVVMRRQGKDDDQFSIKLCTKGEHIYAQKERTL